MRLLLIVCVALLMAGTAAGQVFECVDAKGNKEYAQFCSPGTVKETPLRSAPAATTGSSDAAPAAAAQPLTDQEIAFRKRELERKDADAKAAKEKTDAEETRRECEGALSRVRALQENQRVAKYDSTGEPYVIDDDTRPAAIAAAQKTADTLCKR